MKKLIPIFLVTLMSLISFWACSPDSYELVTPNVKSADLVEGIAFEIKHDSGNPNIVYLINKMGKGYTPLWNHPQGRSQEDTVTLKMPFVGTYPVQFGVETRGGAVWGDSASFKIDNFYADFVNDELWTKLSGGVGKSKTWVHDNGNYGLASGEIDYADPSTTVEFNNFTPNWSPGSGYTGDANIWKSSMTFSLNGGAFVTVHNASLKGDIDQSGMYMIDVDRKTLTFTNAELMHTQSWSNMTANWSKNLKILTLTKDQLQVGILRDPATSGDSKWWIIWNFVSKEYVDNYVPAKEPEPTLPKGWEDDVSQSVATTIKWVLSPETPFNWANLDGSLMNAWSTLEEYPDWTGFNADIPITYKNFSLTMDSKNNSVIYTDKSGNKETGTYTLDEKGVYTFNDITPSINICSWVNLSTSANNQWRITAIEKDISGKVSGIWVGVRDLEKPQYMVYHLIPQAVSTLQR